MLLSCRYCRVPLLAVATLILLAAQNSPVDAQPRIAQRLLGRNHAQGPVESANFIVYANDRLLAARVSQAAERFRKSLAAEWLGRELPTWRQKCPIEVTVDLHPGGETSFAFVPDSNQRMTPIDWQMKIFGPPDRLLDAVLPHEITHTIFATHFGRGLPRWADEGACTTVEHVSEQNKNHRMLLEFLNTSRGIPFNRMFSLREYPQDILPLYAQGFSLAKYLIFQKGKRHFLNYIDRGMQYEDQSNPVAAWNRATSEFYPFKDLSDLQLAWVGWVRKGSHQQAAAQIGNQNLAANRIENEPRVAARSANHSTEIAIGPAATLANLNADSNQVRSLLDTPSPRNNWPAAPTDSTFASTTDSWYASQMQPDQQTQTATNAGVTYYRKVVLDAKTNERPADEPTHLHGPAVHASRHQLPASATIFR